MGHQRRQGVFLSAILFVVSPHLFHKALPLLKAAWDRGVTTIDTANVYSNGESERIIGKFLKQVIQ